MEGGSHSIDTIAGVEGGSHSIDTIAGVATGTVMVRASVRVRVRAAATTSAKAHFEPRRSAVV